MDRRGRWHQGNARGPDCEKNTDPRGSRNAAKCKIHLIKGSEIPIGGCIFHVFFMIHKLHCSFQPNYFRLRVCLHLVSNAQLNL